MELRHLRSFITLAETLNFSEASKTLCLTQSTLSQQIKQLESDLGASLFIRNSHGVAITEAGAELLPHARRTVADADECLQRMADLRNILAGSLNIGVTYSFSPILTETIFEFMKRYPGITLSICYKPMAELMELLRRRDIDFVLAFRPSAPMPDVESHILFQNYLAAIVSDTHPLASAGSISLEELSRWSLALPSVGLQARNALEAILEQRHIALNVRIELNDPNILFDLVRSSSLVTVLAEASVHNQPGVKALKIEVPENEMSGCVHTLAGTYHKKATREFVKLLSESLAVRERATSWL